jgi:GTP-binding protein Era
MYKSGFVSIIGKPNAGKSTVLNFLVGEKVAIVSEKPETTRDKIQGILTLPEAQIVFVDTPGIHKPRILLGKQMVRRAKESLLESDLILLMIDAASGVDENDRIMISLLEGLKTPAFLLLNKIDLIKKSKVLTLIEEFVKLYDFKESIPISSVKGDNMDVLLKKIIEYLPEGEKFYPEDQLTDKHQRFIVKEMIREKALEFTHQEVPHSVAVLVDEMKKKKNDLVYIKAVIFVERDSQKVILIGKKGQMLKKIGESARIEVEKMLNKRVYLDLWIKVYKNWRKDEHALKMLGYI